MHPLVLVLILLAAAAGARARAAAVQAHHPAYDTPAARFWDKALPRTEMPAAIADLIQEGIDHSPLLEHRPGSSYLFPSAICLSYRVNCRGVVPPGLFFRKTQVRVGSTMTVSLPPETAAPILPRDVAKGVPFGDMGDVLARFDISPSSAEAATLAYTVRECQAPTLAGELSSCTTSVEDTVQSAMHMLGTTQGVWAAASSTLTSAGLPHELYAVETVTPLDGGRHVGCHEMPYPYAVFQCHMMNEPSKAYMMSLRSLHGGPTTVMAALCHLDTSKWDPDHVAFKILHTQPGDMPVCHFMPYAHLLFGIGKNFFEDVTGGERPT